MSFSTSLFLLGGADGAINILSELLLLCPSTPAPEIGTTSLTSSEAKEATVSFPLSSAKDVISEIGCLSSEEFTRQSSSSLLVSLLSSRESTSTLSAFDFPEQTPSLSQPGWFSFLSLMPVSDGCDSTGGIPSNKSKTELELVLGLA